MILILFGITTTIVLIFFYKKIFRCLVIYLLNKSFSLPKENKIRINEFDSCISLSYNYINQEYHLYVPFNRDYIIAMNHFKVELVSNSCTIDITQQPGIPYLITARDLGGDNIIITNQENGKTFVYDKDTCPMFGKEVID